MEQIYLFAGIYGFFGSILIVLFKIWPGVLDWRAKKEIISSGINTAGGKEVFKREKFFPDSEEKTFIESQKTYDFYSTLWSFRLIGTGFMITILNSIMTTNFLETTWNLIFVLGDISLLTIIPLFGIAGVDNRNIRVKKYPLIAIIFGFNLFIIYPIICLLNHTSTKAFFVDDILIYSTAISQIIFTSFFFFRNFIEKNKTFKIIKTFRAKMGLLNQNLHFYPISSI